MAKYSEQTWLLFAVSGVALCVECEQKLPCVHKADSGDSNLALRREVSQLVRKLLSGTA